MVSPKEDGFRVIEDMKKKMNEMVCEREKERSEYERKMMVLACREGEWRQERKRLKEEVRRLRKRPLMEEKKEMVMGWSLVLLMEEERGWRNEAMDKWKKLYLEIKKELDDLIHKTTHQGLYRKEEEEEKMEEMKRELETKEETIKALKMKLAYVEQEGHKSKREVGILRQSLRILSINNIANPTSSSLGNNN